MRCQSDISKKCTNFSEIIEEAVLESNILPVGRQRTQFQFLSQNGRIQPPEMLPNECLSHISNFIHFWKAFTLEGNHQTRKQNKKKELIKNFFTRIYYILLMKLEIHNGEELIKKDKNNTIGFWLVITKW